MSVVIKMDMPEVCLTKDGHHGKCLMDRMWCMQKNAPKGMTTDEAYAAMTDAIPSWCPIICGLPAGHGRLGNLDELAAECDSPYWCVWLNDILDAPTIVPKDTENE